MDQKWSNSVWYKFQHPKIDLFGAGWSKFFRPAPKVSQSPRKIFLIPGLFLGSAALLESKTVDFAPKYRSFWESIWPKFLQVVSGHLQKFFPDPATPKVSPKNFWVPNSNEIVELWQVRGNQSMLNCLWPNQPFGNTLQYRGKFLKSWKSIQIFLVWNQTCSTMLNCAQEKSKKWFIYWCDEIKHFQVYLTLILINSKNLEKHFSYA